MPDGSRAIAARRLRKKDAFDGETVLSGIAGVPSS